MVTLLVGCVICLVSCPPMLYVGHLYPGVHCVHCYFISGFGGSCRVRCRLCLMFSFHTLHVRPWGSLCCDTIIYFFVPEIWDAGLGVKCHVPSSRNFIHHHGLIVVVALWQCSFPYHDVTGLAFTCFFLWIGLGHFCGGHSDIIAFSVVTCSTV